MNLTICNGCIICIYIYIFSIFRNYFSFLLDAPHIIKPKFQEIKNTVRVPSRMRLIPKPLFSSLFQQIYGILLFVLKYVSLLLKMINGFSWDQFSCVSLDDYFQNISDNSYIDMILQ